MHYTFGTKEGLYRAVMEQLTAELLAQVEQAVPEDAGFEETVGTLASALWSTVREKPGHHLLLTELSMFALRTPALNEALESHSRGVVEATARLVTQAAERTGHPLAQPAETVARFFLSGFDGLVMQRLTHPDEEAEATCLQAFDRRRGGAGTRSAESRGRPGVLTGLDDDRRWGSRVPGPLNLMGAGSRGTAPAPRRTRA